MIDDYEIKTLPAEIRNNPKYRKKVATGGYKPAITQHPSPQPQQPAAVYSPYPPVPNPYPQSNYYGYHSGGYQYPHYAGYHQGHGEYHHAKYKYDDKTRVKESKNESGGDRKVGVMPQPNEEDKSE